MFVLLVIPLVGGFLAGRLSRSMRLAYVITGVLWLVGSGLIVGLRVADPVYEVTGTIWIGVAVGLLGLPLAWAGQRVRARGSARS